MRLEDAKIGMTVKVVADDGLRSGETGYIKKIDKTESHSLGLAVQFEPEDGTFSSWDWLEKDRVEPSTKPLFIVVDSLDEVTAKHSSLEAAERDARDAAENLKETFTVFQRAARKLHTLPPDRVAKLGGKMHLPIRVERQHGDAGPQRDGRICPRTAVRLLDAVFLE